MSDQSDQNRQPEKPEQTNDFFTQINLLGRSLEQAARAAMENEHTRNIQRDIMAGMQEMFTQLQETTKRVQDDERVQELAERGQQTVNKWQERAQEHKTFQDFQATMARSLAFFNSQLDEFTARMQAQREAEQQSGTGAQHVPIDEEESPTPPSNPTTPGSAAPGSGPATGPTVRLDPDEEQK